MRKLSLLLAFLFIVGLQVTNAQKRVISGKVTSLDDGSTIPGVTVTVKGTTTAAATDINGKYSITADQSAKALTFSFLGLKTQEVAIGASNTIDVVMEKDAVTMGEVVVTALGITREKKSLGYATQEVSGDKISTIKSDNFMNSLSGKVSGVQIRKTTNMGGSTNVLLRGNKSLTGDNQVLFVIDGVPVNNDVTNTSSQKQAGLGYDYGNAASDINPDDIESVNVLKGSAATALYGSRAAGGVIMITTKKGKAKAGITKKGIGISINSGVTVGFVDKSTFAKYQKNYGAGYGQYYGPDGDAYFNINTVGGVDQLWVPTTEDASFGSYFYPDLMVYQWDAVDPESPNYQTATPWKFAENGPVTFFKHPVTFTNSIALENANDIGSYRFSYTNYNQKGMMPNSSLKKDNVLLNGSWKVNDKLTASGTANYTVVNGLGRNSTGYSDNICGSFRQWMQTNVDIKQQWDMYDLTKRNITWNWADPQDQSAGPIYWDNYYWTRYQNYETDGRNRFIGNVALNYKVNNWFNVYGRVSGDSYNELQEERRAVGSIGTPFGIGSGVDGSLNQSQQQSGYLRRDITFSEYNYDLMLNFNKDISKDLSFKGVLGNNIRRTKYNRMISATNGGLNVPGLYSLQNSIGPLPYSKELASMVGVNGIYASASIGYKNFLYVDLTARRDHSSTLPVEHSKYLYPSISTGFIFTNVMPKKDWLSFGKVRLNYAMVGNSASFDQLIDNYTIVTPFYSPITSVSGTKKNSDLKPEKTKSIEGGLEMSFFGRRLGFDLALYKTNTINQILPLAVSTATGYTYKMINAGEILNKGIELSIHGTPYKGTNFKWDVIVNWAKNKNEVISLLDGVNNLQLGSFQGGVTLNAVVGQPYGIINGTDYVYYSDGHKIIKSNGKPLKTATSDQNIGNINPDWTGGITNSFSYKNWNFSFLIDIQKGGDIFSLDMYYGMSSGLYPETDFLNDKGNPVRDPRVGTPGNYDENSGGYLIDGVYADGTPNVTYVNASNYAGFGYAALPDIAFVYDASYVKLREVSLSYTLPAKMFEKCFFTSATFSAVAANPWIIHKNLPYADPESGLGAGNLQGYSTGSLPSTRDFSFNVNLKF